MLATIVAVGSLGIAIARLSLSLSMVAFHHMRT
jgi:hypothetical protein